MNQARMRPWMRPFGIALFCICVPIGIVGVCSVFMNSLTHSVVFDLLNSFGMLIGIIICIKFLQKNYDIKSWFRFDNFYCTIAIILGTGFSIFQFFIDLALSRGVGSEGLLMIGNMLKQKYYGSIIVLTLPVVILYPIFEETIFRGIIQDSFFKSGRSQFNTVMLTAFIFAFMHITWKIDLVLISEIFLLSILLSMLKIKSLSLVPAILMHTAYNATELSIHYLYLR